MTKLVLEGGDVFLGWERTRDGGFQNGSIQADVWRTSSDKGAWFYVVKAAVKPSASQRPARHVTGPEGLAVLRDASGPFIVQPFVPGEMHSTAGVMWRGRLVAAVHQRHLRLWPPALFYRVRSRFQDCRLDNQSISERDP